MARYVLVISADAQAPLSPKLLLFPGALLIFVAQPSLFPCLQKSCCVLERPWQSLRHSALCCSFTRRCGRGVPCLGSWTRGGSPMLWTSLGSPWSKSSCMPHRGKGSRKHLSLGQRDFWTPGAFRTDLFHGCFSDCEQPAAGKICSR